MKKYFKIIPFVVILSISVYHSSVRDLIIPVVLFSIFFGVNMLATKKKRGFFLFNRKMFDKFWALYYNDQTIEILNQPAMMHSLLSWRWFKMDLYVNEVGIFLRSGYLISNYTGPLYRFDKSKFKEIIPPMDGEVVNFKIKNNSIILNVRNSRKSSATDLKLKIKSDSTRFKVIQLLRKHVRELV